MEDPSLSDSYRCFENVHFNSLKKGLVNFNELTCLILFYIVLVYTKICSLIENQMEIDGVKSGPLARAT
jgi:hypothetical protein